jgi:hypothetical protein
MLKVKPFAYGCFGVFLLALAYHLVSTNADAQAGTQQWFLSGLPGSTPEIITSSGDQWRYVPGVGWLNDLPNIFGAVPGGREVVSALPGQVVTSSGEVWYQGGHNPWTNAGVPPLGPTAATPMRWGQLKAKYR